MRMNRRKFLRLMGAALASPLLKACDAFVRTPTPGAPPSATASSSPTGTTPATSTHLPPSATASASPSATPSSPPSGTATATTTGTPTGTVTPSATPSPGAYFSLHPAIENHPEAVFIQRTAIVSKTDAGAKFNTGRDFARSVFRYGTAAGFPLASKIALKANVTYTEGMGDTPEGMGILTDVYFTEGLVRGMADLGFRTADMYLREGNWLKDGYCAADLRYSGYEEMSYRAGIHALYLPSGRRISDLTLADLQEQGELVWKDCPDGVVFRRIAYLPPFNAPDAWLLNVAKLKTHGMGMTLCVKNLQGMSATPYIRFCEDTQLTMGYPEPIRSDFQPGFEDRIARLHAQHVRAGYPRWDRPGTNYTGGYGMESWAQRTCDSLSVTTTGLNVIEGLYGRNGNGFMSGPGLDGEAQDFLTNVLIFGKDPFRVDIVGTWLAGHEPGNFGLFRIARERGLCTVVDPLAIPLFLWEYGDPQPVALNELSRTPLVTTYLRRDYNGGNEAQYHLVDEACDYQAL